MSPAERPPVSIEEIELARHRIAGVALRTPLHRYLGPDLPGNNTLWLKAESLQRTGSFKIRGAYNAVASLSADERSAGVITYSSGNHGQAVACAAHLQGAKALIVMPEDAIAVKVSLTRRWGAEIVFAGHTSLDRQARAMELVKRHGYTVIPPFDDKRIIAGQGTCGLEILEQEPELDAVVVPIGGGGLISGIATAIKALRPGIKVIGVEPESGADAKLSLESGRLTTLDHVDTVADGLRTSRVGELNFATIRACVHEIVTVSDQEALEAIAILAAESHLVVEPSGAVAPAAVLYGRTGLENKMVAAVISGGNIEPGRLISSVEQLIPVAAATQG